VNCRAWAAWSSVSVFPNGTAGLGPPASIGLAEAGRIAAALSMMAVARWLLARGMILILIREGCRCSEGWGRGGK
jgi:hypothetical protein